MKYLGNYGAISEKEKNILTGCYREFKKIDPGVQVIL